jgi:hypothetical protein
MIMEDMVTKCFSGMFHITETDGANIVKLADVGLLCHPEPLDQ